MVNTNGARAARSIENGAIALTAMRLGVLLVSSWSLPVYAETSERAAIIEQVAHACPEHWTELQSPFLGGEGTGFPDGLSQENAATSCGAILVAWPDSPNGDYWIDPDGGDTSNAEQAFCLMAPYPDGSTSEFAALSCNDIKNNYPNSDSGVYWLVADGGDTANAITAYCDMSPAGKTRIESIHRFLRALRPCSAGSSELIIASLTNSRRNNARHNRPR